MTFKLTSAPISKPPPRPAIPNADGADHPSNKKYFVSLT